MNKRKGFTLVEIIVVLVIVAILTTIALPIYTTNVQQGAARAAQSNLIAIYNAQKLFYLNPANPNPGTYYITQSGTNDLSNINTALALNIIDSNFNYVCTNAAGFTCTATNNADSNLILSITNNPILLPGAASCAASPWSAPGCNPSCTTDNTPYCPS